jgi:hypothetical protein
MEIFPRRMQRVIEPAREHALPLDIHAVGKLAPALPILYDLGFSVIHPVDPGCNDIFALRELWRGRLAFVGNFPAVALAGWSKEEIETAVRDHCVRLAPGGGYAIGSSGGISEGVLAEKFLAMT